MHTLFRVTPLKLISKLSADKTLTKKAYLNALASMLEFVTSLLVGFFLTPFMVTGLGDYSFGLWQVLNRLVGYLTPASGRPTFALKWTLANQQSSEDFDKKRRYVGSTLIVWVIFLPILLILGGIVVWLVPGWINAPTAFVRTVRVVSLLLVFNIIMISLTSIPQGVLQGQNLGYKRMGMSAGLVLLGGGLTWLAVYLKTGIIGVSLAVLLGTVLNGLFFLFVIRQYVPWFGIAKPHAKDMREMFGRSWWFLGWNLVTSLLLASDVVILGVFNSVISVTSYTLTKYVPEMLLAIIITLVFAIMPGLGGIVGSGDLKRAIRLRTEILTVVWLLVTSIGATVLLWNRAFIGLWVGAGRYSGSLANLLIVVTAMQLIFIRSDANIIDLTLRLNQKVLLGFVSVTISIVTSSLLVGYYRTGIIGLCLGIILGRLILSVGYPLLVGRFMEIIPSDQLHGIVRPMFVTIIVFGVAFAIDYFAPTITWPGAQTWMGFLLSAGLSGILILTISYLTGLTKDQRSNVWRRIRMFYVRTSSY